MRCGPYEAPPTVLPSPEGRISSGPPCFLVRVTLARGLAPAEARADWLLRALALAIRVLAVLSTLVALVAAAPSAALAVGDCSPATEWPGSDVGSAARVVELVNEHRSQLGLALLQVSGSLASSADWKARHMARYGYMQHSDPAPPVARSVGQRLEACGYTSGAWGENIAYGYPTPEAVVAGWLASPGHRANIENPGFTAIGVGAAAASGGTMYWAQNFGTLADRVVPPPSPSPPPAPSRRPPLALAARPLQAQLPPRGRRRDPRPPPTRPSRSRLHPRLSRPSSPPLVRDPRGSPASRRRHEPRRQRLGPTRRSLPVAPDRLDRDLRPGAGLDRHAQADLAGSRAPVPALKRSRCGTSLAGAGSPSIHGASARRCVRSALRLRAPLPST